MSTLPLVGAAIGGATVATSFGLWLARWLGVLS